MTYLLCYSSLATSTSNKLSDVDQQARVASVHSLLQNSLKLAEVHQSKLQEIDANASSQAVSSALILRHISGGIRDLYVMIGATFNRKDQSVL
jgi:hypothetical protein